VRYEDSTGLPTGESSYHFTKAFSLSLVERCCLSWLLNKAKKKQTIILSPASALIEHEVHRVSSYNLCHGQNYMLSLWQRQDSNQRERRGRTLIGMPKLALLFLATACVSTCSRHRDPQVAYEHAAQAFQRGDMTAAGAEAEKDHKEFHNLSAEWAWKFTILRARVLYRRGIYDEVLTVLASEPAPPTTGELVVKRLRLEGLAYTSLHRFPEAEAELGKADGLCATSDYAACDDVANARGTLEMERGRYHQAQVFFERALTRARLHHDQLWEADALLDLSWSALEQTRFDEALNWADAARKIALPRNYGAAAQTALGNMGWAYYKLGDSEKAEGMFIEATKQAEKLGNITDQARWITDAAYIDLDADRFTVAEQSFQQSLELARQINSREDIINSLIALAFVSEQTGKLDDAKRYADQALAKAREDKNGRDQVYPQLVQGRVAARLHDTTTAENAFRAVAQSPDCPVFLKWEAERSLARLYEDENQFDSAESEFRAALNTFETARSELQHEDSRLPFLSNASRIYDDYIHFLVAWGKTIEALQVADFSRGRTLVEGLGLLSKGTSFAPEPVSVRPLNAQQIARHAGGAVLFYWLSEKESYLWAITPQKIGLFRLPPAAEIKARVERYQKATIDQLESTPIASDDGAALYRILVEPAKDLLPRDAKNGKVFIVPDGSLNSLNFETLLVPETKEEPKQHYWIEDVTLSSASSLRMLEAFHAARKGAGNLLLFGDAIAPNEDFPQLPKASVEMESIKKHFPPAQEQVFSRDQASPPAYLASKPERFSYIHFVAHGTASRLSPLDSAIVLSKANARVNEEEDSFKLYARDIIRHPLRAELVTVSTCRSAGARAYSGEGLVGLSWAFVRAGAHNVIGALWDVSDTSTPQLMDELYGELKKGKTPDVALRNAKLTMLRANASFRKPFYWAPFQLYTGS
jgi:CHAT domain-containing protein